jgi:hypothetical protein
MLKKIEFYYDEDHEIIDIEDEKIYWDTNLKQFRHKFNCCECNIPMGCRCYDELHSALNGVEDGIICDSCGISQALNDASPFDLMDILDRERIQKVDTFIQTIVTKEKILKYTEGEDLNFDKLGFGDIQEIIGWDDEYDKLKDFIVNLMTEDEKRNEFYETCDGYLEGESCNI